MTELTTTLLPAVELLLMTIRSATPLALVAAFPVARAAIFAEVRVPPVMVAVLAPTVLFTKIPPEVIILVLGPLNVTASGPAATKRNELIVNVAGVSFAVTVTSAVDVVKVLAAKFPFVVVAVVAPAANTQSPWLLVA